MRFRADSTVTSEGKSEISDRFVHSFIFCPDFRLRRPPGDHADNGPALEPDQADAQEFGDCPE